MSGFHIVVALSAVISILAVAVYACLNELKRYKKETTLLRNEIENAAARLEHLRQYAAKHKIIEEAADAERRELNETADSGLAARANALFWVRDQTSGGA
jgi:DNA repair ATPase RecN